MPLEEKRRFIIHGREYWLRKSELPRELGCPPEECEKIWEEAKCYTYVRELENQSKVLYALSDLILYSALKTGKEELGDIASAMSEAADRIDRIIGELRKKCKLPPSE